MEKAEYAATRFEPEEMHRKRLQALANEKSAVERSIAKMQEEIKLHEKKLQELKSTRESLILQAGTIQKNVELELPRAK